MKKEDIYKKIMTIAITAFITFIITIFIVYTYMNNNSSVKFITGTDTSSITSYLDKIRRYIDRYYLEVDDIDNEKIKDATVQGYVSGIGDEYAEYIPKSEMEEYTEDITGTFVGIGIYMVADEKENKILVYYPIPGSPAEKAGIKIGDKIIKVDGVEYTAKDFNDISSHIKGEIGTNVNIVVLRDGKELSFDIKREQIIVNPITTEKLEDDIGYLLIPSFDKETSEDFKEKVEELEGQGIKSLIIDLRNNGGGIVDEATEIADYILEKGNTIISTVDNKDKKETTISENKPIFNLPIVVLVNENTASASEILTVALQDNKKATVVGTKTYGKGVIQTVFTLQDKSGLKLTTGEYYTPNGATINKVGVTPDEEVKLPKSVSNIYTVDKKDDTQLDKAIDILKK